MGTQKQIAQLLMSRGERPFESQSMSSTEMKKLFPNRGSCVWPLLLLLFCIREFFLTQGKTIIYFALRGLSPRHLWDVITTLVAFVSHQRRQGHHWLKLYRNAPVQLSRTRTRSNTILQRGRGEDTYLTCNNCFQRISNLPRWKKTDCVASLVSGILLRDSLRLLCHPEP